MDLQNEIFSVAVHVVQTEKCYWILADVCMTL